MSRRGLSGTGTKMASRRFMKLRPVLLNGPFERLTSVAAFRPMSPPPLGPPINREGTNVTDIAPVSADASTIDHIIIRFAGDSGDGMQLTGDRFTSASAMFGNDLATLPDFPAEIRAPAGTLAGVSAFQVQISDHDITTPGDAPSILVCMNPAALASELHRLDIGGTIIANEDTFDDRNLAKAGYPSGVNPLEDGSLDNYTLIRVPMTSITKEACAELGVKPRDARAAAGVC